MKTKLFVLMAILLLIPFVSANAGLVTLDKVKKAGEIWLKGGDDFGASGWTIENFSNAAKLSGNPNPKSNTVAVTLAVDQDFYFAVFSKNSKLKYWGLAKYDNDGYSLQKARKKSFIPAEWAFKKVVPVKAEAPADTKEGNALPGDQPTGGVENNPVGGEFEGEVELEEEIIFLADRPNNGGEVNGEPSNNNGPAPVPEPATMLLLGGGLIGLAGAARRKVKKTQK